MKTGGGESFAILKHSCLLHDITMGRPGPDTPKLITFYPIFSQSEYPFYSFYFTTSCQNQKEENLQENHLPSQKIDIAEEKEAEQEPPQL